jgi:N-acetyl sugar amidotransferase
MPETKLGITFNEEGICNACVNAEKNKNINWGEKEKEIKEIAKEIKEKHPTGYNCLIPVSGGKDSTRLSMYARDELGLKPLCVFVQPPYITEVGEKNIRNLSKLGFDIFRFNPNNKILPKLLKKSFIQDGQPAGAFEFMLYAVPMQVAINYKISLVMWGEDAVFEYGNKGESKDGSASHQKEASAIDGRDASHWAGDGVDEEDLISFQHPTEEELDKAGVKSIYLSHYIKWDSRENAELAIKNGLTIRPDSELMGTGGYWNFEQLDDEIPIISHLIKYIKFGYGRATDQACRDIRGGHITREKGLELAEEYDGKCNPDYIKRFCDYINITEEEFWKIANSFKRK